MAYVETIQGITCYSNIPFNTSGASGSTYTHTIYFNSAIDKDLYDLASILSFSNFNSGLTGQGYTGTISNYSVTQTSTSTTVTYTATSPPMLLVVGILLGLIIAILAAWLISYVSNKVSGVVGGSNGGLLGEFEAWVQQNLLLGIVALGTGTLVLIYALQNTPGA